jgi:hypothetical protein
MAGNVVSEHSFQQPSIGLPSGATAEGRLSAAVSPSTPSPVSASPSSAPPGNNAAAVTARGVPAPRSAINEAPIYSVVEQYRHAFEALQASGVERFWPSVNAKNLQRAFDQMESQRVAFDSCTVSAPNEHRAEVACAGSATFIPKVGNKTPRVESRQWTFHLSRLNAGWTIDRVESR